MNFENETNKRVLKSYEGKVICVRTKLIAMRKAANLSQGQIAMRLNISQPYYCDIEKGNRQKDMTYSMMEKLSDVLGVSIGEIAAAVVLNQSKHEE